MTDSLREARRIERLQKSLRLQALPNFRDPRIHRRAMMVAELGFDIRIGANGRKAMRATDLYKVIGQPNRGPTVYFQTLFRPEGLYGKARTYRYRAVKHRLDRLVAAIGYEDGLLKSAHKRGWSFMTPPGRRIDLPRTGDRVYPWWALMQSEVRHELFVAERGHGFDYDIEAAKPTVTLQAWNRLMQAHRPGQFEHADCRLETWSRMVADRTTFRAELAAEVGITIAQAKDVIQKVLNGAWASPSKRNGLREALGQRATERLIDSPTYRALRSDFKVFWTELKALIVGVDGTTGQVVSAFYNQIEDEIMCAADKFFARAGIDVWFVHDGFMSAVQIPRAGLEEFIRDATGYVIKLEEKHLCKSEDISFASLRGLDSNHDLHKCHLSSWSDADQPKEGRPT